MKKLLPFLFVAILPLLAACQSSAAKDKAVPAGQPHVSSMRHQSKGSFSFKVNGELMEADPAHAKAWRALQMPLTMLLASNDKGLSVSWEWMNEKEGDYKIDGDSKGKVGFTINGKMYWVRSVMKDNYLNIHVTKRTTQATVIILSGTFDGVLEDRDGNKITITDGVFTTESL